MELSGMGRHLDKESDLHSQSLRYMFCSKLNCLLHQKIVQLHLQSHFYMLLQYKFDHCHNTLLVYHLIARLY